MNDTAHLYICWWFYPGWPWLIQSCHTFGDKKKPNKKQKVTWINDRLHDYGQKDKEFTVRIPLMPHFLWLHAYRCKHKYLLPLNNCVNEALQICLSAFVRWRLLKGFPSREKPGPRAKSFLSQACLCHQI